MAFSVYYGVSGIFDCITKQKTGYFLLGTEVPVDTKYPYTISASGPKGAKNTAILINGKLRSRMWPF